MPEKDALDLELFRSSAHFFAIVPKRGGRTDGELAALYYLLHLAGSFALCGSLALASGAPSALETPSAGVLAFDRFISLTAPICHDQPAPECVDLAWDFADYDGDQMLSMDELRVVRDSLRDWANWREDALTEQEQNAIALGLWIVDAVGLEALQQSYDEDTDGVISRRELLADVRLDARPLGELLLDPEAVNRGAVLRRLGKLAPVLKNALP